MLGRTITPLGMTLSREPCVCDPNINGFRHSDTIVVRKNGGEILNPYFTRLDEMVIDN